MIWFQELSFTLSKIFQFAKCPKYPNAVCKPDYCGGCKARWYSSTGAELDCSVDSKCPDGVSEVACLIDPCQVRKSNTCTLMKSLKLCSFRQQHVQQIQQLHVLLIIVVVVILFGKNPMAQSQSVMHLLPNAFSFSLIFQIWISSFFSR